MRPGTVAPRLIVFHLGSKPGDLQLVEPGKEVVGEAGDALVAVGAGRPVVGDQDGRHRDRRDALARLDQGGILGRLENRGQIVILEFAVVGHRQELEAGLPLAAQEGVDRLRRDEHDRRHLALAHLLQRHLVRNEGLLDVDAQPAEDQRAGVGGGRPQGVEVHLLAGEVLQALDLGPDEDVQLRREEIEQVGDVAPDFRELDPVLFQRVGIDDRQIDAAQIEQRIQVLRRAARDDGQDVQIVPVIDDAGHLRRQTQRRALDQAGSEADRPGVYLLLLLLRRSARAAPARVAPAHRRGSAAAPGQPAPTARARTIGVRQTS